MIASQVELLNEAYVALSGGLVSDKQHNELELVPDEVSAEIEDALLEQLTESDYGAWFGTGRFRDYKRAATDAEPGLVVSFELPSSRVQNPAVALNDAGWRGFKQPWIDAFLAAGITLPDEPESSAEPAPAPTAEAPQEPVRASVEPRKVNDATFIGGDLPTSVYDLPLDIGIAGGRDAKRWPGKKMKFGEFVGSLTKHTVGEKDGKAFIQGTAAGNERKAKAMTQMCIVGLDLDSGIHPEPIAEKIQNEFGLACVIYTTHSHHTTETHVVQNSFAQWARKHRIGEEPTLDTMRKYMREAKKWEEWVVQSIVLADDPVHTTDGISYILQHQPMPKFRIIFPLAEPYVIAKQKLNQKGAIDLWKGRLLGLAKILDVPIDQSCLDPSRLFYLPRHKEGRDFKVIVTSGKALDFNAVPAVIPNERGQKPDDNIYAEAARNLGATDGANFMFGDFSLKNWAREAAGSFDIAAMFREVCLDHIRHEVSQDKLEVLCPWDHEHGNAGDDDDRACMVRSAHADGTDSSFYWGCRHNSCQGRDRLDFVCEALRAEWFTTADLENEAYRIFTVEEAEQPNLPKGFVRKPNGICFARTDANDNPVFDFVCNDFDVIGEVRDENSNGWGIIIEFEDKGKRRRERIAMSELQAGGKHVRERLTHKGFRILASTTGRNRCDELLSMLSSDKQLLDVTRAGFHEWNGRNVFVSPTGVALDAKGVCQDVSLSESAILKHTEPRGTLDGWLQAMNHVAAAGVQHWILGAATGFAGPILNLLKRPSTGVALIGDTSQGKSLGQEMGAAVWAHCDPNDALGLFRSARETDNAMEGRAAISHGTLLAIDELALMKPEAVGDMIFMLSSGSSKGRMKASTALTDVKAWRCFYTVSAERSIGELIESGGKTLLGGHSVRLPTLNVSGTRKLPADEMAKVETFRAHFGQGWRPFITHLFAKGYVDDPAPLRERLDTCISTLVGPAASAPERRAVETIALLQLAGEVAIEAGALPATMDFQKAAKWGWASFMTGSESEALSPAARVVAAVRKNLSKGWGNDIVPLHLNAPPTDDPFQKAGEEVDGEGQRWRTPRFGWFDTTTVYIDKEALVAAADGVASQKAIAQHLRDAGLLEMNGDKLHWPKVPRRGKVANYRLKVAELMNGTAEEADDA